MGPPPFGGGNDLGRVWYDYIESASMGPPPFGGGNFVLCPAAHAGGPASMGPPPFGGGNLAKTPHSLRRLVGFNGATAFRRWKPGRPGPPGPAARIASMGPPPFGGGNPSTWATNCNSQDSFNGATAFRRWKRDNNGQDRLGDHRLQWGHRLSAVETIEVVAELRPKGTASMGPPPFGGGNRWAG